MDPCTQFSESILFPMRRMRVADLPYQLCSVGQMLQTWGHGAVMSTIGGASKSVLQLFQGPLKAMIFWLP